MTRNRRTGETVAAQAGHFIDPETGAVTPPIQPSVTFARDADYALVDPASPRIPTTRSRRGK
jgi:cystathionine gamma-synthase